MAKRKGARRRIGGWAGQVTLNGRTLPGYYIKYRDPATGRRVQRKAGETREEAEAELAKVLGERKTFAKSGVRDVTLDEFAAAEFMPTFAARVGAIHRVKVTKMLKAAADFFGDVPMHVVTRPQVEDFLAEQTKPKKVKIRSKYVEYRGAGPNTLRRYVAALSACWRAAVERHAARENVVKGVKLARVPEFEPVFLTPEQVRALVAHLPEKARPIVVFLAETGARYSEAAKLRWPDVAPDRSRVTVTKTKNAKVKTIHLTPVARGVLAELHEKRAAPMDAREDFVFPRVHHRWVYKLFKDAVSAAGLPERTRIHDLRHSVASQLAMAGVPLSVVRDVLGHASMMTTQRYAKHTPATATEEAMATLAKLRGETPRAKRSKSATA